MTAYENDSDEQLIARLRMGEQDIMDYILDKYKPMVRKRTNALYLIGGENEDLIQEGMIGLFKAVRDYREEKEVPFFNFALLCINRQLYSALESSNRKKHQPLNSYVSFSKEEIDCMLTGVQSPEELLIEQEKLQEWNEVLQETLSKMERQVLHLYLDGNNYMEIAKQMEKSPKSIDNALQRIRHKIKLLSNS